MPFLAWPGAMLYWYVEEDCSIKPTLPISIVFFNHGISLLGPTFIQFIFQCKERAIVATPHMWHMLWWEQIYVAFSGCVIQLALIEQVWLVGLGVWFSLWVREVPGSNPGRALILFFLVNLQLLLAQLTKRDEMMHTSNIWGTKQCNFCIFCISEENWWGLVSVYWTHTKILTKWKKPIAPCSAKGPQGRKK